MANVDPHRHWDGFQWLAWDGMQWRPEGPAALPMQQSPYPQAAYAASPTTQQPMGTTVGYGAPSPALMTDQNTNGAHVAIAWVIAVLTLGYMLPWAVAATRGKANAGAIAALNFFLGWTFIGWIAALVMACGTHQVGGGVNLVVQQSVNFGQPAGHWDQGRPAIPPPPPPPFTSAHGTTPAAGAIDATAVQYPSPADLQYGAREFPPNL